jgi:hypothetical protein
MKVLAIGLFLFLVRQLSSGFLLLMDAGVLQETQTLNNVCSLSPSALTTNEKSITQQNVSQEILSQETLTKTL